MGLGFYYEDFSWDWDFKEIEIDYICDKYAQLMGVHVHLMGL